MRCTCVYHLAIRTPRVNSAIIEHLRGVHVEDAIIILENRAAPTGDVLAQLRQGGVVWTLITARCRNR
eukprot:m.1122084 g.1122084  ORF g.1122084 m.1122084 type:complete len:68 (+) comp24401_c1_seq7:1925-2128(+)